jgi:hypothetical protein
MTKSNITEYDNTAANNTDVEDVPLGENLMYPSHVNNAFREMMADLADVNDGTVSLTSPSFAAASLTGNLSFGDNDKAIFGAGSDLQIYHDGSNSYIWDAGTGLLQLRTNGSRIEMVGQNGSEYMARFEQDGAVKLYYNNAQKLATTSTGIDVTGGITATEATFSGNTSVKLPAGTDAQRPTGVNGMLRYNSDDNQFEGYADGAWGAIAGGGETSFLQYNYTATAGQTTFSGSDDNSATLAYTAANLIVTLNGIVLENGTDYTATSGTSIVLAVAAALNDELNVVAFKSFTTADMVPASTGGTFTGNVSVTGNLGVGTGSPEHALSVFKDSNGNRTEIGIDNIDQRLVLGAYFESGVGQYSTIQSTNNAETTATSLVLQPDGGNIGVGTSSSPNATLQVEGTDDANNLIVGHNNTDFAVYTDSTVGEIRLKAEDGSGSNFSKYMTFYTHPSGSAATERLRIESNGNLQHLSKPAYFARAWVNFNGTGTVAIRSSRNVSSVTDNGTGNYTVNLTTAVASNAASITDGGNGGINRAATSRMISTTECDVRSMNIGTNQPTDVTYIDVVIFD